MLHCGAVMAEVDFIGSEDLQGKLFIYFFSVMVLYQSVNDSLDRRVPH